MDKIPGNSLITSLARHSKYPGPHKCTFKVLTILITLQLFLCSFSVQANDTELMMCRTGGSMKVHVSSVWRYPENSFAEPSVTIAFEPHSELTGFGQNLQPGQCGWMNKKMHPSDGNQLIVRSPEGVSVSSVFTSQGQETMFYAKPFSGWPKEDQLYTFKARSVGGRVYANGNQAFNPAPVPSRKK